MSTLLHSDILQKSGQRPAPTPLKRRPNRLEHDRKPPAVVKTIHKPVRPQRATGTAAATVIQKCALMYDNIPVSESKQAMRQMKQAVNPATRTIVKSGQKLPVRPQQRPAVTPQNKPAVKPQQKRTMTQVKSALKPQQTPEQKPAVTPQQKPVTPQQKPAVPPHQKSNVTPQQKPVTPQQKSVTPQQKPVAPQQKPVTPQQKPVAPQQKPAVTPQEKPVTPQQKPSVTPQDKPVTPQHKPVAPQQKSTVTPQQKLVTPQQKSVTPQQKPAVTPQLKPTIEQETQKDTKVEKLGEKPVAAKPETVTPATVEKDAGPSVEPTPDGHYELNPLMTHVLDSELHLIMAKVWPELPDSPHKDADNLVTKKFKSHVGDALKNALGLNVAKRLLNVHNPLYMRLKLSQKPEPGTLKQFQQKYNCIELRQKPGDATSYIAQMRSFDDFDLLYSIKDLKCGSAKVILTPCYKFTQCPPLLRTIYHENSAEKKHTDKEVTAGAEPGKKTDKPDEGKTKSDSDTSVQKINKADEHKSTTVETKVIEENSSKKETSKAEPTKEETKPVAKTVLQESTIIKESKTYNKVLETKADANETSTTSDKTADTPSTKETSTQNNDKKENEIKNNANVKEKQADVFQDNEKKTSETKDNGEKKSIETKDNENKTSEINDNEKKSIETKNNEKEAIDTKDNKKKSSEINDNKKKSIETKDNKIKTIKTTDKANENNDYDELDDHDILALMSEGIVLDECSGSDDE